MTMSRKDYRAMAEVLNKHQRNLPSGLVYDLSAMLRQDNPRFNAEIFSEAIFGTEEA
tara:strand:+ start:791 stop:961 length:171 start_codon:yes stop_codon:yes gene_type:complete